MSVKYIKFSFSSRKDGLKIDAMAVAPEKDIIGVVQIIHGMCEHKERYTHFMEYLAEKGYLCVIHDNRGHGDSVKDEADWGYFYEGGHKALIDDAYQLMMKVKKKLSDVPYILVGHSMGTLIARCMMKKHDSKIDRLILLGSPSKPGITGFGFALCQLVKLVKGERAHSKILDYVVVNSMFEKRFKHEKMIHSWISSDREVVEKFNNSKKCTFTFTTSGYVEMLKLLISTYNKKGWKLDNPELPILFLSGRDDPCNINPKMYGKSVHNIKQVGYYNVSARLYGGMRHEVLNEKNKNRVYNDIYEFISK